LERCRDDRATLPRPIEVLQRDDRRVNAGELGCRRVIFREGERDGRVIDGVARCDIPVQTLYEGRTIWRAGTRDLDRLAVGPVHGAITITGASWVNTS